MSLVAWSCLSKGNLGRFSGQPCQYIERSFDCDNLTPADIEYLANTQLSIFSG